MPNVKYTDSATFRCLENLKEGSLDISLIHTGKEHCPPGHICSMPRDEFIIHFVLDGTGFYSAGGQTWSLTPGQMFVIYPNEPVTYGADETNPWSYAWIGFRGIRAHSMVKECGFSKNQLVLPAPDQKISVPKAQGTVSLVAGMVEAIQKFGFKVAGFDAYVTTNVIRAAGVSSSASFEMLVCSIINYFFNDGAMTYINYAKAGQYAENVYWLKASGSNFVMSGQIRL